MSAKKAPQPPAKRKASQRSPAVARGRANHLVFFWVAAAVVGLAVFGKWQYAVAALVAVSIVWLVIRLARKP